MNPERYSALHWGQNIKGSSLLQRRKTEEVGNSRHNAFRGIETHDPRFGRSEAWVEANCELRVNWFLGIDLLRQHRRRAGVVVGAGHIDRSNAVRSGGQL